MVSSKKLHICEYLKTFCKLFENYLIYDFIYWNKIDCHKKIFNKKTPQIMLFYAKILCKN